MSFERVVLLAGGVGGARLADGLAAALPAGALRVIVNTGDDFAHWGLHVSPDVDTVVYTLAGLAHPTRGWGLEPERFEALAMVERYGGPTWFSLGDRDLAMHLMRTEALRRGERLTTFTARIAARLDIATAILPMSDLPRPTIIDTEDGEALAFQTWFVERRARPRVRRVRASGEPRPTPEVLEALDRAELVVIAPSNPYVSIDPILALDGVAARVRARPVVALSPIVRGAAVKGPLAEMIASLAGAPASPAAIARHYGFLSALVVEAGDEAGLGSLPVLGTRTVMGDRADRARLARELLALARRIA